MLSTCVVKNVGQASHYFSDGDNYYTKDEGVEQSEWYGKGAKNQNLDGKINKDTFERLLHGITPDGETLGKVIDDKIKHRAGWDLTLSAPKSVSLMALIAGDKRLVEAHRDAVKTTLDQIERSCAQARIKKNGSMSFERTNNITAALYHHDLSRAKDPQLHTHSVVMNMTQRNDGKWRSLASSMGSYGEAAKGEVNGFIERVRNNNRYYSKIYAAELAIRVKELGYEINTNNTAGVFEIEGISREVIETFSKRRLEIESELENKGMSGGKAASYATLSTREKKEVVNREEIHQKWNEEIKNLNVDLNKIKEIAINSTNNVKKDSKEVDSELNNDAIKLIQSASKKLAVFQNNFTIEQLIDSATKEAVTKNIRVDTLLTAIDAEKQQGNLISISNEAGKSVYMAKKTLNDENSLAGLLKDNLAKTSLISSEKVNNILSKHTEIVKETHSDLLSIFEKDKIVLIEGRNNKDRLIESCIQIAHSAGLKTAIVSSSQIAGKKIVNEINLTARTFLEQLRKNFGDSAPKHYTADQFIFHTENGQLNDAKPQLLIVEQANLLSTYQKLKLAQWTADNKTKLLLFGEQDKLLSYQVSTSLKHIGDQGIKTIANRDSMSSDSVIHSEKMPDFLKKIGENTLEIEHQEDRQQAISSNFMRIPANERISSLIVTPSKAMAESLNNKIHEELSNKGELNKLITYQSLTPVYIDREKSNLAASYTQNQVVRFNQDYRSMGIKKGDYLHIKRISSHSNRIILENENGSRVIWNPTKSGNGKLEVFVPETKEIGVGEKVVFLRTNHGSKITKGERFIIDGINKTFVKLKDENGKIKTINLSKKEHCHFSHGYAATLQSITHERPENLIADLPANNLNATQRWVNQLFSQSENVSIYTDNLKKLENSISSKSGNRFSANEIKQKSDSIKASFNEMYNVLESEISKRNNNQHSSEHIVAAINAVNYALHHLTERSAGFTNAELMTVAIEHALGSVKTDTLTSVILAMEKSNILIRGSSANQTIWTTLEAVKTEREIIALSIQDKGKLEPITGEAVIKNHFRNSNLREEQIGAISQILSSTDRVLSIQGRAGTGKTTMMTSLDSVLRIRDVVSEQGYVLRGLAPTNKAVKELTERGISSQTLDSFLAEIQKLKNQANIPNFSQTIFVLDEASMVSNQKMLAILKTAQEYGFARLIITGDIHQNPAIEAGKPHDLVQNSLDKVINLEQIQRQKNPILKEAALALYDGKVDRSFELLSSNIIEIKNADNSIEAKSEGYAKRIDAIVQDYLKSKETDNSVQIIAPAHADRKEINNAVRSKLENQGELKGIGAAFSILLSKDMSRVERSKAKNFDIGNVLKFNISQSKDIKSNDFYRISDIKESHNLLVLTPFGGEQKEVLWQVPKSRLNNLVEVFKEEKREIKEGDRLVWMKTNKQTGVLSSELSTVKKIDKNKITVVNEDKEHTFDATEPKNMHWDHGYALTTYSTQGGTYNTVLGFFETSRAKLMNLKTFLVTITRPVNELRLYTNSAETLQNLVKNNSGDKLSSLQIINDYPKSTAKIDAKKEERAISARAKSNPTKEQTQPRYDKFTISRIIEAVNKDAEKIAVSILGKPLLKGSNFVKFGSHQGSLSVTTKGERQGWWNDFSEGKGGRSMLSFVQHHAGLSKKEAIKFCADWAGIIQINSDKAPNFETKKLADNGHKEVSVEQKLREEKKVNYAKKLASQSLPAKGTLVEKYLKEHRGIALDNLPEDVRFHAGIYSKLNDKTYPAMLVIARDHLGNINAVQATYLDPETANKVDKSLIQVQKQSFGVLKGSLVTLHKGEIDSHTAIAEGIETGLSVSQSLPKTNVKVTLSKSNFLNIDPKSVNEKVVFFMDQDGKNIKEDKAIYDAGKRLSDVNKKVSLVIPDTTTDTKRDYNDVLKQVGASAIKRDFESAIPFKTMFPEHNNIVVNGVNFDQRQIASLVKQETKLNDLITKNIGLATINKQPISDKSIQVFANEAINAAQKIDNKINKAIMNEREVVKTTPSITRDFEQNI